MKTANTTVTRRQRPIRRTRLQRPVLNPHVFSLMSVPFPVFVTNEDGKIVPTITLPEFAQITRYQE